MQDYVILKQVKLKSQHFQTGHTKHFVNNMLQDKPYKLCIVQYPDERDYVLLIHYSKEGEEITDTFHETIEDAMEQANLEFSIKENEWEKINE